MTITSNVTCRVDDGKWRTGALRVEDDIWRLKWTLATRMTLAELERVGGYDWDLRSFPVRVELPRGATMSGDAAFAALPTVVDPPDLMSREGFPVRAELRGVGTVTFEATELFEDRMRR